MQYSIWHLTIPLSLPPHMSHMTLNLYMHSVLNLYFSLIFTCLQCMFFHILPNSIRFFYLYLNKNVNSLLDLLFLYSFSYIFIFKMTKSLNFSFPTSQITCFLYLLFLFSSSNVSFLSSKFLFKPYKMRLLQ